jgi:tape measure domain-containing protein
LPNNTLKAKVDFDTGDSQKELAAVEKRLNAIFKASEKVGRAVSQIDKAIGGVARQSAPIDTANRKVKEGADKARLSYDKLADSVGNVMTKLRRVVVTAMALNSMSSFLLNVVDPLTQAENKLNVLNAKQVESSGGTAYNSDRGYSNAVLNQTQETLDKIYTSAQKVRIGYNDMMGNVAKSMTLAGDAFQNNTDNAIRFQEIMAEAYSLSGASAAEISSSMYQMVQALGSGVLQGDELRSVREGASMAYMAIEEYAQSIYNTQDSLKDMASEGLITAEIVTAAILKAGDRIDGQFENTYITYAQALTYIKNVANKAFEPVYRLMRTALNSTKGEAVLVGIGNAIQVIANVSYEAIQIIGKGISWMVDNWNWLKWIAISVITAITVRLTYLAASAAITGAIMFGKFLWGLSPLYKGILLIGLFIAWVVYMGNSIKNTCDFILQIAFYTAVAIVGYIAYITAAAWIATGTLTLSATSIAMLVIALATLVVGVVIYYLDKICGFFYGVGEVGVAVATWIGNAWNNMCNSMSSWFNNAIADMLESCGWLLDGINKIREALKMKPISVEALRAKADRDKSRIVDNNLDISGAWNKGYARGSAMGSAYQDKINAWGSGIKDKISGFGIGNLTDKVNAALGIKELPNVSLNPSDSLGDIGKGVGATADNTGKMADSMEMTKEDLEYLRRVADMEWKKEFTTASITVDMSNYNTISGDGDLDGIVTRLADKLYEELDMVANGVYA